MEFIDGPSLDQIIEDARAETRKRKDGKQSATTDPAYIASTVERVSELAAGLHEAHQFGLVHRDVKPSNILVDKGGRYVLVDFGLVHEEEAQTITRSGEMIGTLPYMSPEQVSRRPVDARSDVYSLGVTLHELLTLEVPFKGESEPEIQNAILFKEPALPRKLNPRLNRDLETILLRAIEKDPDRRYQSAVELADDLERFLRYEPIHAKPQSGLTRLARRAWKHKGRVAVTGAFAILLLIAGVLGISVYSNYKEQQRKDYEQLVREAIWKMQRGQLTFRKLVEKRASIVLGQALSLSAPAFVLTGTGFDPLAQALSDLEDAANLLPRFEAPYYQARAYLLLGDRLKARQALAEAVARRPDFVPAKVLQADIEEGDSENRLASLAEQHEGRGWTGEWIRAYLAMRQGDWEEAAQAFEELIRREERGGELYLGSSVEFLLGRGMALVEAKEYREAIEEFAAARHMWGEFLEPALHLGRIYCLMEGEEDAELTFESLYGKFESDETAYWIALTYGSLRKFEAGLRWAHKIKNEPARLWLSAVLLRCLHRDAEAIVAAKESYEKSNDARLRDAVIGPWLGLVIFFYHEGDYGPEIEEKMADIQVLAEKALAADPANGPALILKGLVLQKREEHAEAERCFREALRVEQGQAVTFLSAFFLFAQGEYAKAEEFFLDLKERNPRESDILNMLARVYQHRGKHDEAIKLLREALVIDPNWAHLHNKMGISYRQQGLFDKAIEKHQQATRARPTKNWGFGSLAWANFCCGRLDDALDAAREAERLAPGKLAIHWIRSSILERKDDLEGALRSVCHCVALNPHSGSGHEQLARLLCRQGGVASLDELDGIVAELEAVASRKPSARLLSALALVLVHAPRSKNLGHALEYAREAVKLSARQDLLTLGALAVVQYTNRDQAEAVRTLEEALCLPRATRRERDLLEKYRRDVLPDLPTCASIDAALAAREAEREGARLLEEFREVSGGDDAGERISYLKGRIHQRAERLEDALEEFRKLAQAKKSVETVVHLRLAESLRGVGRAGEAEEHLRQLLEEEALDEREVWNRWLTLCLVDLHLAPEDVLAHFPKRNAPSPYADDLRWLLGVLPSGEVRIDCGSPGEYQGDGNETWGRDRFFKGGKAQDRGFVSIVSGEVSAKDARLYQTERFFPVGELHASYRIPLRSGTYVVRLHFAETLFRAAGVRTFDVLIEGEPWITDQDTYRRVGFAVPDRRNYEIAVEDGSLDLEFVPRPSELNLETANPSIAAIEIQRLE